MSKELIEQIAEFDRFLNEPPDYEDRLYVRDYRHSAYARWLTLRDALSLSGAGEAHPSATDLADLVERPDFEAEALALVEAMLKAGVVFYHDNYREAHIAEDTSIPLIWRDMIDAALNKGAHD